MIGRLEFLETADVIGRRLCRDALWAGGRCNWLGWGAEPQQHAWAPAYQACPGDLYEGTAGISLFLARLYRFTGDRYERKALEGAVNHVLSQISKIEPRFRIGFFSGATGAAYALTEAGRVLEHDTLIRRALDELHGLRNHPLDASMVDVIVGCAGAIPALIDVGQRFDRQELVDLAVRYGEHLLGLACKTAEGWSWDTMGTPGLPHLTGFAHGAAGVVTALLEVYRVTQDDRFVEAARQGLCFERSHFSAAHGNWPDFREQSRQPNGQPGFLCFWCHGAPGIGMSRLRCWKTLVHDTSLRDEIEVAIRTTKPTLLRDATAGRGNYSLCHGVGGNSELMMLAAEMLGRGELAEIAEHVGLAGIEQIEKPGLPWPCGTHGGCETPNLMTGLAGIGHFYLRLYDAQAVPSILVLEPSGGKGESA